MDKKKMGCDVASCQMLGLTCKQEMETIWDRFEDQQPQCGFGQLGLCCKNCNYGPCRIDPFGEGAQAGACGADADTISARNMARHAAGGSACHSDHGREIAHTLYMLGEGKTSGYSIKDPAKLRKIAEEFSIETKDKDDLQIAKELGSAMLAEFGKQHGELTFTKRAPQKQQETWKKLGIIPRSIDREVVEVMSRTHMGVDTEYQNIISGAMRVGLADGWGGSMIGTEASDILFGSPKPLRAQVNLGVLKEDTVNIIIHGHVPLLSDVIVDAANDEEMLKLTKEAGATGITIAGICCTANEILMRRGVPVAGNILQQELSIATGVVEAMVVDVQCILPGLPKIAGCFHTKLISTHPKAKFPGMTHIEFSEANAAEVARTIVKEAISNFPNRDKKKVNIPKEKMDLIAGFTAENIFQFLGGKYRATYRPLNDAIMSGRLRGVAGVVGCENMKNKSGGAHVEMVKELIKHDVLVVQTGCSAIECAQAGLLTPEAAKKYAGGGIQEICEAVGIPPVLHLGSCVDNTRILIACCNMVNEGGIGASLDELPVAGAAPEWMSEKAIAIGWYFVASGAFVVFGTPMPITGSKNVTDYCTEGVEKLIGGKWAFEEDPIKGAHLMIDHINKQREKLKLAPVMYAK